MIIRGQDLPARVHRSDGSEDASAIGRRNESSEVLQETARTGRDLPGTLNRGRDVLGIVDRTDAGRARVAGPYEPDLLPSPVVVAERVDKVLRPGVDQEASLVARVVDAYRRVQQKEVPRRRCQRDHAAEIAEVIPMADRGHRSTRADPERGFRREALRDEVDHTASLGPHKRSLERRTTSRRSRQPDCCRRSRWRSSRGSPVASPCR